MLTCEVARGSSNTKLGHISSFKGPVNAKITRGTSRQKKVENTGLIAIRDLGTLWNF
jgi:hypothetical protein